MTLKNLWSEITLSSYLKPRTEPLIPPVSIYVFTVKHASEILLGAPVLVPGFSSPGEAYDLLAVLPTVVNQTAVIHVKRYSYAWHVWATPDINWAKTDGGASSWYVIAVVRHCDDMGEIHYK